MEYVKYYFDNSIKLDKLKLKKDEFLNSTKKAIKNHKIITFAVTLFCLLSAVNAFMIYNFMMILKTV